MAADGAAAVEVLRAELARTKELARRSNVATEKASAELKAEQTDGAKMRRRYPWWRSNWKMPMAVANF